MDRRNCRESRLAPRKVADTSVLHFDNAPVTPGQDTLSLR